MEYWLHRIGVVPDVSRPLLEKAHILTNGWSFLSEEAYLQRILREPFDDIVEDVKREAPKLPHRSIRCLPRFLKCFKKGDEVLVPIPLTYPYSCSVYKIKSEKPHVIADLDDKILKSLEPDVHVQHGDKGLLYKRDEDEALDLGFYWEVELCAEGILKEVHADRDIAGVMNNTRVTNRKITRFKESMEKTKHRAEKSIPIRVFSIILEKVAQDLLQEIEKQLQGDDRKFEKLVEDYFKRVGATILHRKRREKGDADVIAGFPLLKTTFYIQVKLHDTETLTDEWAAEQIRDYIISKRGTESWEDIAEVALVITTAKDFTEECKALALKEEIILVNGREFAKMLLRAGLEELIKSEL